MNTAKAIRRANLKKLLDEFKNSGGNGAGFAEKCGIPATLLSRIAGNNPDRNIGDELARKLEHNLKLPLGWFDSPYKKIETIGDRIYKLRAAKDLTLKNMAEAIKWPITKQSNYESGAVDVTNDDIDKLATFFDVDVSYLLFGDNAENLSIGKMNITKEAVTANNGDVLSFNDINTYLDISFNDPSVYAVKIKGDYLYPRINSGEFIVLNPAKKAQPGDEVIVKLNDGQSMIKKFESVRDESYRFTNIAQPHSPMTIDSENVNSITCLIAIVKN